MWSSYFLSQCFPSVLVLLVKIILGGIEKNVLMYIVHQTHNFINIAVGEANINKLIRNHLKKSIKYIMVLVIHRKSENH